MSITIDNSIYNGTFLHDIPHRLEWYEEQPPILYKVDSDSFTIRVYSSWYSKGWLSSSPDAVRTLFLHDLCHCILYVTQREFDKLFKDDFGLSFADNMMKFGRTFMPENNYHDECKVIMLNNILTAWLTDMPLNPEQYISKLVKYEGIYAKHQFDYDKFKYSQGLDEINEERIYDFQMAYYYWSKNVTMIYEAIETLKSVCYNYCRRL